MPDTQMAENLLDDLGIVNHGDEAHGVLADGAAERVHVPDPEDEVPPALGREFCGRRRGDARAVNHEFWR